MNDLETRYLQEVARRQHAEQQLELSQDIRADLARHLDLLLIYFSDESFAAREGKAALQRHKESRVTRPLGIGSVLR